MEIKKITCEKHGIEYEAKYISLINLYSDCPLCKEEKEAQRLKYEEEAKKRQEARELMEDVRHIDNFSNIPQRYINFSIDESKGGFANNSNLLNEPLSQNVFIIGDTGAGKTLFLTKLLMKNARKKPYYLSGNELNLLKDNDYRLNAILEAVANKGIVAIDEVQDLILNKRYLILDLIVDKAYMQGNIIVLCGNLSMEALGELKKDEWRRVSSRIKQGGLKILDFGKKDLRWIWNDLTT